MATVTVVFNANGGEGRMSNITRQQGKTFFLPYNDFEYENHIFLGWSLTSSGEVKYADGAELAYSSLNETVILNLYAQWLLIESDTLKRPTIVDDMYKYAKKNSLRLLSNFSDGRADNMFWKEYLNNNRKYDKLFNRMFNSFKYFMQKKDESIGEITVNFIDDVFNHLMVNAKKYEELYRVYVVSDEDYSITDNYNITETLEKEISKEDSNTLGEREDSNSRSIGAKTVTDSNTENIGAKTTTVSNQYGAKQVDISATKGEQTDSAINDIAGFNSATYAKDNASENVYGSRSDSSREITAARTDSESTNEGAQSITESKTINEGAQTITDAFTKGEQTDTFTGLHTEEYILTRKGNIGVRTITEVLEYHEQFWSVYEFYTLIFKEICAELLSI